MSVNNNKEGKSMDEKCKRIKDIHEMNEGKYFYKGGQKFKFIAGSKINSSVRQRIDYLCVLISANRPKMITDRMSLKSSENKVEIQMEF